MKNPKILQIQSGLGSVIRVGEEMCTLTPALVEAIELCPRLCEAKIYQPICIPGGSYGHCRFSTVSTERSD